VVDQAYSVPAGALDGTVRTQCAQLNVERTLGIPAQQRAPTVGRKHCTRAVREKV
jgi:hypothetical protein